MLKVFSPFNVIFVVNSVQNNNRHIIDRHKHPEEKSLCSLYSKPILSRNLKKLVFKTYYRLMQVKSIADAPKGPSLSYHLSMRSLFCLCLRGRLMFSYVAK